MAVLYAAWKEGIALFMTDTEYQKMMLKNPSLRVHRTIQVEAATAWDAAFSQKQKGSKYWNWKVFIQERGVSIRVKDPALGKVVEKYDSMKEYDRFNELTMLLKNGIISDLKRQVSISIQEAFTYQGEKVKAITYRADFTYFSKKDKVLVVEDVKGFDERNQEFRTTQEFNLKWKLLKHRYPTYKFMIY